MDIEFILNAMIETMERTKPPRLTALRELQNEENNDPLRILIGTIISARTRDENSKIAVRNLFSEYKDARALANADVKHIALLIKPAGFYRVKAERIKEVAKILLERYNGIVPDKMEELLSLPGVGRKTANCVLVYAFNKPAIPVDTHVHRISNRLGIVNTDTPEETESELSKKIDKAYWNRINDTFVMFGQNICKPLKPLCSLCMLKHKCRYYKHN